MEGRKLSDIIYDMKVYENIPIAKLTTMRLGGPARYVIEVESRDEVPEAIKFAKEHELPIWVMGGGANTIGHDAGFEGVILLNKIMGFEEHVGGDKITIKVGGGVIWDEFVDLMSKRGYTGVEALSLIPGTVGAAPVQNIGAYGQSAEDTLVAVEAYDLIKEKFVNIPKSEMGLGYRRSRFNRGADEGRYFITSVTFELKKGELKPPFYNSLQRYISTHGVTDFTPQNIRRIVCEIRNEKLPDPKVEASAGSFFKNVILDKREVAEAELKNIPVWKNQDGSGKINAGWLIETAGLKGGELGGFRVSEKAALILINDSAVSYGDLMRARQEIIDAVKEKFGYELEQEPVEIPER